MQTDVILTLILLTCATIPFYMLGAGVLHRQNMVPDGLETVSVLSATYTHTLGDWAYWLFMGGAFLVLYSTAVSGLGGAARAFADAIAAVGLIDRTDYAARTRLVRGWAIGAPALMAGAYFFIQNPVIMLFIGNMVSAAMAPILAGGTLYLRYRHLDRRLSPSRLAEAVLWLAFLIMLSLAAYIIYLQL